MFSLFFALVHFFRDISTSNNLWFAVPVVGMLSILEKDCTNAVNSLKRLYESCQFFKKIVRKLSILEKDCTNAVNSWKRLYECCQFLKRTKMSKMGKKCAQQTNERFWQFLMACHWPFPKIFSNFLHTKKLKLTFFVAGVL